MPDSVHAALVDAARGRDGAETMPTVVFVSSAGDVLARVTSVVDDAELHAIVKRIASHTSR